MTDDSFDRAGDDVVAVTVSEERMRIGTVRTPFEIVRITKRVVTETVQVPVQLRHEELTITHHPIDGADMSEHGYRAEDNGGAESTADGRGQVIVLHREVPVVTTRIEANEKITIRVDEVVDEQAVTAELRREQVDVDGVAGSVGSIGRT